MDRSEFLLRFAAIDSSCKPVPDEFICFEPIQADLSLVNLYDDVVFEVRTVESCFGKVHHLRPVLGVCCSIEGKVCDV